MFLWDFLPCKVVYDNIIYKYKYATDFVNVGMKLLNTEVKDTKNGHTEDLKHTGHSSIRLPPQVMMQPSSCFRPRLQEISVLINNCGKGEVISVSG